MLELEDLFVQLVLRPYTYEMAENSQTRTYSLSAEKLKCTSVSKPLLVLKVIV